MNDPYHKIYFVYFELFFEELSQKLQLKKKERLQKMEAKILQMSR